jgi:hypothetical protein
MQRSQGTRRGAFALAGSTERPSAPYEGQAGVITRVLLITRDHPFKSHISRLTSDCAGNTLEIESVDRVSEAAQRLKKNVGIDAGQYLSGRWRRSGKLDSVRGYRRITRVRKRN